MRYLKVTFDVLSRFHKYYYQLILTSHFTVKTNLYSSCSIIINCEVGRTESLSLSCRFTYQGSEILDYVH